MNVTIQKADKSGSTWSWVTYGQLVSQLNIGESLKNESIASYSIMLYMSGSTDVAKPSLTPGTIIQITIDSKVYQFVIVDGGKIERSGIAEYCYHSYTVQPLECYFRDVYIQTAFFSANEYTLSQFFTRLLALTKSLISISISTSYGYSVALANWVNQSYQVSSNAFLDNIIAIGDMLGVKFKPVFSITAGNALFTFRLLSLKGSSTISTIDGDLVGKSTEYKGATFASKAIGHVKNLLSGALNWYPSDHKIYGFTPEPDNDDDTISADNAVVNIGIPIDNAIKVRAIGFGKVLTDYLTPEDGTDYRYYDMNGNEITPEADKYCYFVDDATNRNKTYIATEYNVVEYNEWLMLDPDSTGGAPQHQQNTLYYKEGETKIFNISICDGLTSTNIYTRKVWSGGVVIATTYKQQRLRYYLNYYVVQASAYSDPVIVSKNALNLDRVSIYSQNENTVSGQAFVKNIDGHIDSMANAEESMTYDFDDIADVPEIGSIYNGMVISNVGIRINGKKIQTAIVLSDDLVSKSEYINTDAGVVLPAIPYNKAYDRVVNYETQLWFCRNLSAAQALKSEKGLDLFFNAAYLNYLTAAFENGRSSYPTSIIEARIRTGDDSSEYLYSASPLQVFTIGKSLFVNLKINHASVIGKIADTSVGTAVGDVRYYPITYVDADTRKTQNIYIRFCTVSTKANATNYPRLSESNFNALGNIVNINDTNHYHDPAELINATYQLTLKNDLAAYKVTNILFEESNLFKDTFSTADLHTRYVELAGVGSFEIESVALDYVEDGIYSLKLFIDNYALTVGNATEIRAYRKTGTTEEDMLTSIAYIDQNSGTGQRCVKLYIASTK